MAYEHLINAAELADCVESRDWLVVDCRFRLTDPDWGRLAYQQGHIPGAVFADLDRQLSDRSKAGEGRHPLPEAEAFCATLRSWGMTGQTQVVAYDDAGGAIAGRLWWLLRHLGHRQVAVLDGGIQAWTADGHELECGSVECTPGNFDASFGSMPVVDAEALQAGLPAGSLTLVDARAAVRFRGEQEPIDSKAGHIPGAINSPFDRLLDPSGEVRSRSELDPICAAWGAGSGVVHSCGSGVTACFNLLVGEWLGRGTGALFPGSWSGWISDPTRDVAAGPE